jgi:hypothetical protein
VAAFQPAASRNPGDERSATHRIWRGSAGNRARAVATKRWPAIPGGAGDCARHGAYLHALGYCVVSELPLPSGRRADLVALGGDGEIIIVEIKSSVADFRADQKWMDYRQHCDRLFFATHAGVPCNIFPAEAGLIVADAFGAAIICEAPEQRIPAATRKSVMLRFAHAAALRLQAIADPQGPCNGQF